MSSLFLSYRRSDSPGTVKQLYESLRSRLPRWTLFYDHRAITPGEDFPERLRQEVTSARVVLVIIGPRWAGLLRERRNRPEVDHVREEVRLALQAGNIAIPVLVENASPPKEADLADFPELLPLLRLNGRAVRPDPDFDTDFERLAAFLDELGPGVGAGTVLAGKYKILGILGQGGMGIVYEAEQLQPRRRVAVKMVLEGMDTKEVLARFDGEKEALARLNHPNIAGVIDSGSSPSGKPFFVMEFVKGEPITTYCDRKRLPPNERLKLFQDVCDAVQHAHQKGIIHRDMKPSNVLVEEIDGQPVPKVIDFGLAKALAGRLTDKTLVSELGKILGTLIYASPEQVAGRQYDIDTRTDVYSLGVILYELLAGEPPFTERDLLQVGEEAMRREIIETEPSKPSTKLSSSKDLPAIAAHRQLDTARLTHMVRGELDWIVMKALEKEPDHRYATPNAFAEDLRRYVNNEPISVGRPSTLFRLRKFARRNRGPVIAASLVFAVLVTGVIGTTWGLLEAKRQESRAHAETHEKSIALRKLDQALAGVTKEQKKTAAALAAERDQRIRADLREREARRAFSNSRIILAQQEWVEKSEFMSGVFWDEKDATIARDRIYEVPEEFRFWEWHYLDRLFEGGAFTLYGHLGDPTTLAYATDGRHLFSGDRNGEYRCWDARTGRLVWKVKNAAGPLAVSPDGRHLAVAGVSDVLLLDAATGQTVRTISFADPMVLSVAFSRGGAFLAVGCASKDGKTGEVAICNVAAGQVRVHMPMQAPVRQVFWSPYGTEIVVCSEDRLISRWSLGATKESLSYEGSKSSLISGVCVSPDFAQLAVVDSTEIKFWAVHSGEKGVSPKLGLTVIGTAAFSSDGSMLAVGTWDGTVRLWNAWTGAADREFRGPKASIRSLAFSPDGRFVAAGGWGGMIKIWNVNDRTITTRLRNHSGEVKTLNYSPDGRFLATGDQEGHLRLWDTATGTLVRKWQPDGGWVHRVEFDPVRNVMVARVSPREPPEPKKLGANGKPDKNMSNDTSSYHSDRRPGVFAYDLTTGAQLYQLPPGPSGYSDFALSCKLGCLVACVASGSEPNAAERLLFYDVRTGTRLESFPAPSGIILRMAFHPDGTRLACADQEGRLTILDAKTGRQLASTRAHTRAPSHISYSGEGSLVATAVNREVTVWDVESLSPVCKLRGIDLGVMDVRLSPDGERVATCTQKAGVRIWDSRTGQPLIMLRGGRADMGLTALAFSPDGRSVAAAIGLEYVYFGDICIWSIRAHCAVVVLRSDDDDDLDGASIHPNGSIVAAWSNEAHGEGVGKLTTWDVSTGRTVLSRVSFRKRISSIQFGDDPERLRVKLSNGDSLVIDARTGAPAAGGGAWAKDSRVTASGRRHVLLQAREVRLVDENSPTAIPESERVWATAPDLAMHNWKERGFENSGMAFAARYHLERATGLDPTIRASTVTKRLEIARRSLFGKRVDRGLPWLFARTRVYRPELVSRDMTFIEQYAKDLATLFGLPIDLRVHGGILLRAGKAAEALPFLEKIRLAPQSGE